MVQIEQQTSTVGWLVGYGDESQLSSTIDGWRHNSIPPASCAVSRGSRTPMLLDAPANWAPAQAGCDACQVVFDGFLYNRAELRACFADGRNPDPTDAEVVAQAYQAWGDSALPRLRGVFALIIWDTARDRLVCARDPLGMHPLFYAQAGRTLLLSPSIDRLRGYAGMPTEINRAVLAERLAGRWHRLDETYFTSVRRISPGLALRVDRDGHHLYRYWDPAPLDEPIEWVPDDEAEERFEALLAQAVGRCVARGPAGIFLSGGLDSVTVAAVAADVCQHQGRPAPWALSMGVPTPDWDEQAIQRAVAADLGLPHVLLDLDTAAGDEGIVTAALELSRAMPAPLLRFWRPAYNRLALEGRQRGCQVILTGEGGDECLDVTSFLAADLVRSLDLVALLRLWCSQSRSYPFSRRALLRELAWGYGARAALYDTWRTSALRAVARRLMARFEPGSLEGRQHARMSAVAPSWLAPDPALRAELAQRAALRRQEGEAAPRIRSFYLQDAHWRLDHPEPAARSEEIFFQSRRVGLSMQHPYWDPDLIQLVLRIRPQMLHRGGLTKSLVRRPLVRRFPSLKFERQRKRFVHRLFDSTVSTQAAAAYGAMRPLAALGDLGVVDPRRTDAFIDDVLAGQQPRQWGQLFNVLNLEAWSRAH